MTFNSLTIFFFVFQEFDWDEPTKSKILSGFFWGYLVMQLPAGVLGQRFSPKLLLFGANAACAILALLIPSAATYGGWMPVFFIRVCQGLSQVPIYYSLIFISSVKIDFKRNKFFRN